MLACIHSQTTHVGSNSLNVKTSHSTFSNMRTYCKSTQKGDIEVKTSIGKYQISNSFVRFNSCISLSIPQRRISVAHYSNAKVQPPEKKPFAGGVKLANTDEDAPIDLKVQNLANEVVKLNMLEMVQFARVMSKLINVPYEQLISMSNPQQVVVAAATPAASLPKEEKKEEAPPPPKVEKTTWNLKLVKMDEGAKYKILKEIRALKPGMKIDESKKYVENLPQIILEDSKPDELAKWEEKLKAVGGHMERV